MRAAVVHSWGDAEQLGMESVPDPVAEDGEVIVELHASSLNWHDVIVRKSGKGSSLPSILGMDGAGIRLDTGQDTVIYPCLHWGDDETAPSKDFSILGDATDGTYAGSISVPADNLYPKPAHLSWEEAAALPCAGLTAYRAVFTRAKLQPGETLLVLGAGSGVSTFAVMFGAAAGARVLVTSSSNDKIESVRTLGADRGFLYTDSDWVDQVLEATDGGVDVVISGVGANLADALGCLKTGGRIAVFGSSAGSTATFEVPVLYFGQFTILGTTLGSPTDFRNMLAFVEEHRIRPVIDSTWALDDVVVAHKHLESRRHLGKIVLSNRAV